MKNKKVVGLGAATIDFISIVPQFPAPDSKMVSRQSEMQGGGNAPNTLVALSRLGLETGLVSMVGNDIMGCEIIAGLEREGVDTRHVYRKGDRSHFSFVLVSKKEGTRTIVGHPGPSYSEDIPFEESVLQGTDIVYLDGRFHDSALRLARLSQQREIPVFVEAERKGHHAEDLFPYADVVFASGNFQHGYFGALDYEKNLDRILEQGPRVVVTTLGSQGAMLKTADEYIKVDAYKVDAVDTTGAGDAFNAGFIYGCLNEWEPRRCLEFGALIAAKKCKMPGSRTGLPFEHEVREMIEGMLKGMQYRK